MIDRIISFITYFPENLCFHIGEYEFYGLCLKPGDHFPWASRKERSLFLDELAGSERVEDLDKFIHWNKKWYLNRFHRRFTWSYIFQVLSYCTIFLCFPAFFAQSKAGLIVFAALALCFMLAKFLSYKSISRLHFNLNMTRMAVDMLKQNK